MKVYLVDGTYELFRAYHALPPMKSPDGRQVAAVRGLLQTLMLLLRQEGVTHLACAFDQVIESFRNRLFDGYKTGEGVPQALLDQFPLAERAAAALGVVVWPMTEFEADDAIATAAARWADDPEVGQVVICSTDKDLMQMVRGSQVVCLDRRRGTTLDESGVWEKFGVSPASIPDYLALVGDSADGIPGLPGWGARSSSLLLAHYGRLEGIPQDPAEWEVRVRGAGGLSAALRERWEDALLYRKLATLRTDVLLAEGLEELRWQGVRRPDFQALCSELGFESLVERAGRDAPAP